MTKNKLTTEEFQEFKSLSLQKANRVIDGNLWAQWHDLADVQHQEAKKFFIECLQDIRPAWREMSTNLLGFHYDLEKEILEKIRALLISDPISDIRLAAAGVLGHQSKLPENALIQALVHDSNPSVKKMAFSSLLQLAGVSYKIIMRELERIDSGETTPNLDQVKDILEKSGMDVLLE